MGVVYDGDTRFLARTPPGCDVPLTVELRSAVAGARRRAARYGDRQIDTAHLLHSLLEADPAARAAIDRARLARVLGYLVQRSIGYGARWHGAVEESAVAGRLPARAHPRWSPAAAVAMGGAVERAHRRAAVLASGPDLLAALATDPCCRAAEVLRSAGVDPGPLAEATGAAEAAGAVRPESVSVV